MAEDEGARQLVLDYVGGWKDADAGRVLETLRPDCVVVESHGTTYRGKEQVERWIESWFAEGNLIDQWDVTSFHATKHACAFEWVFSCTIKGVERSFEGASLALFKAGTIALLREYRMTQPRYDWDG
ncbi:MAG TPA: nuclear transport factor 2 family protein [Acidimicrobiia bacterium]|nr:nuclear transport factor 2 family protein [Acidimicrobiia bacterium]